MRSTLFREEASAALQTKAWGRIVMVRPPRFAWWTGLAVATALAVIAFLVWGSYAPRASVAGRVVPSQGLIKVSAGQGGRVAWLGVAEGQAVRAGQPLLRIDRDQWVAQGDEVAAAQALISAQTQAMVNSLDAEHRRRLQLHQGQRQQLQDRLAALESDLVRMNAQLDAQALRIKLLDDVQNRYRILSDEGIVSKDQWQLRQADWLNESIRLTELQRQRDALRDELRLKQQEREQRGLSQQDELADLERRRLALQQEQLDGERQREVLVRAPLDGRVSALAVHVGQVVDAQRTLLNLLPGDARLTVHLQVPGRAVGLIAVGDVVRMRFPAYPHQKHGHLEGVVQSVSDTPLSVSELAQAGEALAVGETMAGAPVADEVRFLVQVSLPRAYIVARERQWPLRPGMAVEADVLGEPMRLYEWVLEPLRALKDKVRS